jgi:hypothetical protein
MELKLQQALHGNSLLQDQLASTSREIEQLKSTQICEELTNSFETKLAAVNKQFQKVLSMVEQNQTHCTYSIRLTFTFCF